MVEAVATDCLGRELRSGGESFGGGAETYAFSLLLLLFEVLIWVGDFRVELEPRVGVLALVVGVMERFLGVLACEVGGGPFCCLEVLPLAGARDRFAVEGELERVEAGLPRLDELLPYLAMERGSKEEVGDKGGSAAPCEGRRAVEVDREASLAPCTLLFGRGILDSLLWSVFWRGTGEVRYQSVGEEGSGSGSERDL